jgi:hypothetical protein
MQTLVKALEEWRQEGIKSLIFAKNTTLVLLLIAIVFHLPNQRHVLALR